MYTKNYRYIGTSISRTFIVLFALLSCKSTWVNLLSMGNYVSVLDRGV